MASEFRATVDGLYVTAAKGREWWLAYMQIPYVQLSGGSNDRFRLCVVCIGGWIGLPAYRALGLGYRGLIIRRSCMVGVAFSWMAAFVK